MATNFNMFPFAEGTKDVPTGAAELIIPALSVDDLNKVQSVVFQSTDGVSPNGNSATATISIGSSGVVANGAISIVAGQSFSYGGDWEPGSSAFIDVTKLYCISDTAGQKLQWQVFGG